MQVKGITEKKFHLENNLWVCGFRSMRTDYDETLDYYNIHKFRENPRFKEITIELNCSFHGRYAMIPVEVIDNFEGFEKDEIPNEPGWFLGIMATSQFLTNDSPHSRTFNGPYADWYRDAAFWWEENEKIDPTFFKLCELYAGDELSRITYNVRRTISSVIRHSINFNSSLVREIVVLKGFDYLIDFIKSKNPLNLFHIFYVSELTDFNEVKRFEDSLNI